MDGTAIDDAEDLDFLMPMYILLEYSPIILIQQIVCGFTQTIKQIIFIMLLRILLILNLSSIRVN